MEAQPGGTHSQLESCSQRFAGKKYVKWSPRGVCAELVLFDISISHLDDGRESTLMKFADSSKPGWMASSMWDRIRIQNDLDALERGVVAGGGERERGRGKALHLKRKKIDEYKMETYW